MVTTATSRSRNGAGTCRGTRPVGAVTGLCLTVLHLWARRLKPASGMSPVLGHVKKFSSSLSLSSSTSHLFGVLLPFLTDSYGFSQTK